MAPLMHASVATLRVRMGAMLLVAAVLLCGCRPGAASQPATPAITVRTATATVAPEQARLPQVRSTDTPAQASTAAPTRPPDPRVTTAAPPRPGSPTVPRAGTPAFGSGNGANDRPVGGAVPPSAPARPSAQAPLPLARLPVYPGGAPRPGNTGERMVWALAAPAPTVERWMYASWRDTGLRFICQRSTDNGAGNAEFRWQDAAGNVYGFVADATPDAPDGGTILTITTIPAARGQTC